MGGDSMKESIGYTVTLNIVITFIIIVFAFLSASLVYFKSNKVSNVVTDTILTYEGYNDYAKKEINLKITSLGYNKKKVNCKNYYDRIGNNEKNENCKLSINNNGQGLTTGEDGYCIFICNEQFNGECYYYYKISTNMMINIPIINDLLNIPIFSNANRLYNFEDQETCKG